MISSNIKTIDGKNVLFETYLTTKAKQSELVKFAKTERGFKGYDEDRPKERYALIVRAGRKPVELITQTMDEPTELYLTIVGWDEDMFFHGGDDSPYTKFQMYTTRSYRT